MRPRRADWGVPIAALLAVAREITAFNKALADQHVDAILATTRKR
jgi:hypothetical protein